MSRDTSKSRVQTLTNWIDHEVKVQGTFWHLLGLLPYHMTLKLGLSSHVTSLSNHVTPWKVHPGSKRHVTSCFDRFMARTHKPISTHWYWNTWHWYWYTWHWYWYTWQWPFISSKLYTPHPLYYFNLYGSAHPPDILSSILYSLFASNEGRTKSDNCTIRQLHDV